MNSERMLDDDVRTTTNKQQMNKLLNLDFMNRVDLAR